ncbi:MAG: SLC13 family permease [Eubacteriales bacterium]|nr:SLC13 family permease [Eubacteriales bacterium]
MNALRKIDRKTLAGLITGPLFFALCMFLIPDGLFGYEARAAIGTLCWMGAWWIMMPIPVGVTGFIPIIVNALFNVMKMDSLLAKYATDTIFLLIGADLLTISWKVTGLDKRVALRFLYLSGPSLTSQVLMWFLIATAFAMVLPNLVVCSMLTPIAFSMLRYVGEDDLKKGRIAPIVLCAVAWGSGLGGMATPFSGAMNLVAIGYIEEYIGREFMYTAWSIRMVPMLLIVAAVNAACIMLIKPRNASLKGSREYYKKLYSELPKMSRDEFTALFMFVFTVVMTFARNAYAGIFPALKPAYLFLIMGVLTFIIRKKSDGEPFNNWKEASREIGWGLLIYVAGGIALGAMLIDTGAVDSLAVILKSLNMTGGFGTVLLLTAFAVILSEISNHSSAAAIVLPIAISVCRALNLNAMPYIYTLIAAYNTAFMMPTAVRAIPVGLGLSPSYLMKRGALLTFVSVFTIALTGFMFMSIWPAFSGF